MTFASRVAPLSLLAVAMVVAGCTADAYRREREKIEFEMTEIDDRGLEGPAGGKRRLAYEFCIPSRQDYITQVRVIDPSLQLFPTVPGRAGCTTEQILAIGHTAAPEWRERIERLAALRYVKRILRSDFE
jgi:hypothetical protein